MRRTTIMTLAIVMAAPTAAIAQSVEAETLFREGKRLVKEGKIAEGCEKLEGSAKLESSVGTLLNLADCREKNNQLATAWVTFRKAASTAKLAGNDPKREAEARKRADALEERLSYLTITVADPKLAGLVIKRNGGVVDPVVFGTGLPLDAGTYEIVATAPGFASWSKRIEIGGSDKKITIDVPALHKPDDKTGPPPHHDTSPDVAPRPKTNPDDGDEGAPNTATPSRFTPLRKASIAMGAVGVVAIAVGVVRGLHANDLESQADAICPTASCADPAAVALNADARDAALQTNVLFGVGGAFVAGAAVLWFVGAPKTATDHVSLAPIVGGHDVGLVLGGRF
jgi:hypothetical protein